jgi:hypothetical protein
MTRCRGLLLVAAACALAPLAAWAQRPESLTYRCVGKDHHTYYGQTPPPQCAGLALELLNRQGLVVRRIDPKADAEKKAREKAEAEQKRKEEAARKEQQRRDRALLATFTSAEDIERARQRALADNAKALQLIDTRIADIKKHQDALAKELEFYRGKKPPVKLQQDVNYTQTDLERQQAARERRQKEVATINAKYDEDKRRYAELTRGGEAK